jgi:hypothetical protein
MRGLVRGVVQLEPLSTGRVRVCANHLRYDCEVIDEFPVLFGDARDAVYAALRDRVLVRA